MFTQWETSTQNLIMRYKNVIWQQLMTKAHISQILTVSCIWMNFTFRIMIAKVR